MDKQAKCIVIACHTSSAVAGGFLKKKLKSVPVFDVVSPVLERLEKSKNKKSRFMITRKSVNQ